MLKALDLAHRCAHPWMLSAATMVADKVEAAVWRLK